MAVLFFGQGTKAAALRVPIGRLGVVDCIVEIAGPATIASGGADHLPAPTPALPTAAEQ